VSRRYTGAEARALREAATEGPWEWRQFGREACDALVSPSTWGGPGRGIVLDLGDAEPYENRHGECDSVDDRALIAAAPDLAATVEALEAELLTVTAQRDSSFGYVESIETALNEAGVDDVVTEWSGHPEDPPYGRQADPLERVVMLAQSRDGWRLRVEALEAERDALAETCGLLGERLDRHAVKRAESYEAGRDAERAAAVAFLRREAQAVGRMRGISHGIGRTLADALRTAADGIERGEHVAGGEP
jgi:hypothetical protein